MFEVTKAVFIWNDKGKPEDTPMGKWTCLSFDSARSFFASPSVQYRLAYTVCYENKAEYERNKSMFDKEFYAGLLSLGYDEEKISSLLEKSKMTFYEPPATFRDWQEQRKSQ